MCRGVTSPRAWCRSRRAGYRSDLRDVGIYFWRRQALDVLDTAIRGRGAAGRRSRCRSSGPPNGSTRRTYDAFSGPVSSPTASAATRTRCRATPTSRSASPTSSTAAKDVVRYFKNERFGFSVTYYESNRPRQYYPDFIVVTSDEDGREVTWLAETKGEIRPNTALKSEAARLWCEKMSGTKYGQWRYLFVAQRDFDRPSVSSALTLGELADRVGSS